MPGSGVTQPERVVCGVDEIPDATTAGDLVLPLLHSRPAVKRSRQAPLELVMPTGRYGPFGPRAQLMPGRRGIGRRLPTEHIPALSGLRRGEPQVPLTTAGRRRHPVTALGRHLTTDRWRRHRSVVLSAGSAEHGR